MPYIARYYGYLIIYVVIILVCNFFLQDDFINYIKNYEFEDGIIVDGIDGTVNEIYLHVILGPLLGAMLFHGLVGAFQDSESLKDK